jgi:V/A-type H+/Na+-transporting ATPase subunit E
MGIEKLKGSLLAEAQEDANKILASAHVQAKIIADEEHAKCSVISKEAEADVERLVVEQRNERLAWARLESRRILAEAREDAIKGVIDDFFGQLKGTRKSQQYRKFMASAVAKAAKELGAGVTVHIVKGDKSLLPALKDAKVIDDLKGLGGAIIESADGKFRIDLTLESLLDSRRDDVRKQVYEKLFGS